ncbi:disease resistance protein RUN1-like isoform X2 [Corylus avellana]|uniref:disease resistance protein RUN1-like isoform X2 n=1 Tax=Corylus avellana TaxID=13451 RepID=UPI00286D1934|nr:disease resistance protein RUN1-like isoform X2 [Corylus avellana]
MAAQIRWNYDVFLSFRGEDTRKTFTDHLYTALVNSGIHTFRDDDELPRGERISTELLKAIQESKVSIVVFSKGYASSSWCLDELVEIVRCKNSMGQTLLPIFYDVNPSDVRKQTGTFAEAFAWHADRFQAERVHKWRTALTEAANYSGWDLQNVANGYESRFIQRIVEEVLCKLNNGCLDIGKHPISIGYRTEKIKALLNLGKGDVHIVGIYGMGGIGKTTLAKAVYNQIYNGFEGSSCLLNIKEISKQPNGLVQLQEQLISEVLKSKNLKIANVERGINLIKERFRCKRVLVILDDVDHLKQLNSLAGIDRGSSEWFGPGSRVILTTRDEHLLTELGVHEKYKVEELDHEESLQLFSWHAFGMAHPIQDYKELSISVVNYAGGLPLALETLGSYLSGRSTIEWKNALEKLQIYPHHQIQKILRMSFDSLDDDTVKDTFLDIACFFVGMDKDYAIKILDGCDFFPEIGINILVQRSLVTIIGNGLWMHDLIRDMGREIVRERSSYDLKKRSRLWFHDDALYVLNKQMGSEAVEGLILNPSKLEDVHIKAEAFAKMKNLRLLQINGANVTRCYRHIFEGLRWLCWHRCPLKFLPSNFHLENLVILDMQNSNVKQVWKEIKILSRLKVFNLKNSKFLTKTPNFSQVPNLEILILESCTSLVRLHESIGNLERLVLLNLKGCHNLGNLPKSTSNLKSLQILDLSDCPKIDMLPEQLGNMMALEELHIDRTAIGQLPASIVRLVHLKYLSLSGCKGQSSKSWLSCFSSWISRQSSNPTHLLPASISGLCSLRRLDLYDCNLSEDGLPIDFGCLSSLEYLDIGRNNFLNLPHFIGRLPKLTTLWLSGCASLQSISELPTSLRSLTAMDCTSLETLPNLSNLKSSRDLDFANCQKLVEIQGLESLEITPDIYMENCNNLAYHFRRSLLSQLFWKQLDKYDESRVIILPGSEVPNWFSHQGIGWFMFFELPPLSEGEIQGLLFCAVYAAKDESNQEEFSGRSVGFLELEFTNKTGDIKYHFWPWPTFSFFPKIREDHLFVRYIPLGHNKYLMERGEKVKASLGNDELIEVKKCGIHFLFDDSNVSYGHGRSVVQYVDFDPSKKKKIRRL